MGPGPQPVDVVALRILRSDAQMGMILAYLGRPGVTLGPSDRRTWWSLKCGQGVDSPRCPARSDPMCVAP